MTWGVHEARKDAGDDAVSALRDGGDAAPWRRRSEHHEHHEVDEIYEKRRQRINFDAKPPFFRARCDLRSAALFGIVRATPESRNTINFINFPSGETRPGLTFAGPSG